MTEKLEYADVSKTIEEHATTITIPPQELFGPVITVDGLPTHISESLIANIDETMTEEEHGHANVRIVGYKKTKREQHGKKALSTTLLLHSGVPAVPYIVTTLPPASTAISQAVDRSVANIIPEMVES